MILNDLSQLSKVKNKFRQRSHSILTDSEMSKVSEFINENKVNKITAVYRKGKLLHDGVEINTSNMIDVNDRVSVLHLIKLLEDKNFEFKFVSYRHHDLDTLYDLKLVKDKDLRFKSGELNRMGILLDTETIKEFDKIIEKSTKHVLMYDGTSREIPIQDYRYIRKVIARNLDINVSEVMIDAKYK